MIGQKYSIKVSQVVIATGAGAEREIVSEPVSGVYTTKPLPPKDFKTEEDKIMFSKSNSPIVRYL